MRMTAARRMRTWMIGMTHIISDKKIPVAETLTFLILLAVVWVAAWAILVAVFRL